MILQNRTYPGMTGGAIRGWVSLATLDICIKNTYTTWSRLHMQSSKERESAGKSGGLRAVLMRTKHKMRYSLFRHLPLDQPLISELKRHLYNAIIDKNGVKSGTSEYINSMSTRFSRATEARGM
jgi:hypothetical protein